MRSGPGTPADSIISQPDSTRSVWKCGKLVAKAQIVFIVQTIMIYIVCIFSLVMLTREENKDIYLMLLSSCLGYLLPHPKPKYHKTLSLKTDN